MPIDMAALTADLAAESADLVALLIPLGGAQWDLPTPARGWAIRDQVSHLAAAYEMAGEEATRIHELHNAQCNCRLAVPGLAGE